MARSSVERRRVPGYLVAAVAAFACGCSNHHLAEGPPADLIGKPWANAGEVRPGHDADTDAVTGLSAILAGKPPPPPAEGKPLNVLVMSGGGKYGAFTAGILNGWTASGKRPTFDVATGVSSGAVVATLAYVGPKYDQKMASYMTTLSRNNVYEWRIARGLLTRSGLMTAEPLEQVLNRAFDEELMADLRAAHAEGRRLYVATGEVLSNRVAVWDVGAIASSGRPDAQQLLVKIYAAACAPPGVVHPIEISVEVNGRRYTELHTDAGNILQAFVRTPNGIPPGSTFWVLSAGKYYRDPLSEPPRILNLVFGAVSNSLYALFRADLVKLYGLCAATRSEFRLIALPPDFKVSVSAFAFDQNELVRLYWIGYQMTAGGSPWRTTPPDTAPGEVSPPRTGTQFMVPVGSGK